MIRICQVTLVVGLLVSASGCITCGPTTDYCGPSYYSPCGIDNDWAKSQGYETLPAPWNPITTEMLCMGGARYSAAFRGSGAVIRAVRSLDNTIRSEKKAFSFKVNDRREKQLRGPATALRESE